MILGHASDMSIKVERKLHDMRMDGMDCESAKHETIHVIKLCEFSGRKGKFYGISKSEVSCKRT